MGGSQGLHPPDSASNLQSLSPSSSTQIFDIFPDQFNRELNFSNILRIGTLNVFSLVHSSKQLNLFSLLFSHQLHGLILTETNLCSPAHKYVCEPYLSQYLFHKWFSFSPSVNHHAGVGIILHSSLAILISECHSTLVSWITAACSTGAHVLLGGDLNADFDSYLKNISDPTISSPINPLFKYLHSHQFDDFSNHLSRLDLPAFPAAYLWSYVSDSSDTFSTDYFLLIGFFDFLNIRDLRALSYLKQRSHYRTEFNVHTALPEQKILFTAEVDSGLKKFKPSMVMFFPSFYNEFINLFPDQNALIKVLPTPITLYSVFISSHLDFLIFLKKFRSSLRTIKRFISGKVTMEFDNHKQAAMKATIAEWNSNFYEDKGKFIRNSLNREKCSIVLDRVLVTDIPGNLNC
uniref:Endonuclease/exonuclease/phosphatase domain-containing protein n=1 Tax=Rhizophagus irregularis (strain DAOM 181602 / DAOM 197198 / MUCL 43194) TaxID=747089 RepID=U9SSQ2_RHIID